MRIIIFDLFDTILDKVWFDYDKVIELLSQWFEISKVYALSMANEYREKYMSSRSKTNVEASFIDQLKYYEICLQLKLNKDYYDAEWIAFSACRKEKIADDVVNTLTYFKERGYRLAVLSNSIFSACTLKRYMQEFGVDKYFDAVLSSADIGVRKPAARAFKTVLEQLEIKVASEIFFVGNNMEKDIIGAINTGLKPIFLNKTNEHYNGISVGSLAEVKEYFEKNYIYINYISEKESLVDGPGLRTVIFLQGCNRHCVGCHNKTTWDLQGGERMTIAELATKIKEAAKNKKITITGGEPLLQEKAVLKLLERLSGYDICLYTGNELEKVSCEIINKLHYIKVGDYEQYKRTTVKPYVGSSNQRLIDLRRK